MRASPLRLALVAAAALAAALGATRLLGPRAADDAPDADAARRARIAAELRGAARDGAAGADGAPLAFPSAAEEGSLEARDGAERLFATASARPGRRGGGEGASARADGGAARAGPEPGAGPASSARGATVSALAHEPGRDDGAAAALAASGKGTVVGRVALASGDPAAGARVEVGDLRPDHGGAAATADDGGAFAVACDPGLSWLLASSAAPATRSALLEVRVVAGETTDLGIVLLDAPGAIEGVVRDRGGSPAPGVDVRVRVGEAVRPATTASDGRFAFPGVPAGRFLVHADAVPGEEGGVTVGVEVKPGATSEVTLGGSPQITGVLLGPLGAPAPSGDRGIAIVDMAAMRSANTADLLRAFVGAGGRFVPTDEQGRFAVGGLPPGSYIVGKVWAIATARVVEGATAPVEVVVEPCVVRARFAPPPGEPLPDAPPEIVVLRDDVMDQGFSAQELVLSSLSGPSSELAPPGGAAALVPVPGVYRVLCRGPFVPAERVVATAAPDAPADVVVPLRAAPGTVTLRGFPPGEAGFALAVVAGSGPIAFTEFSETGSLSLPDGDFTILVLHGGTLATTSVELSADARAVAIGPGGKE